MRLKPTLRLNYASSAKVYFTLYSCRKAAISLLGKSLKAKRPAKFFRQSSNLLKQLVTDLNAALQREPALHERDADADGFRWAIADDPDDGVLAFLRFAADGSPVLFVANFTPVVREYYRVPVPVGGFWREIVNTDALEYGGSGAGNLGGVDAVPVPIHEFPWSLTLRLPPLGALLLRP